MITKGILKTIDYNNNSCTVRLPLFEGAGNSTEVVLSAVFLNQPGSYNGYNEGDIVFVDFENDKLNNPIVLGKLYLGAEKENSAVKKGGLTVANLNVTTGATLPLDTKLVFEDPTSTVPVSNGLTTYKSLIDIIKGLYKNETSITDVAKQNADAVASIKVEYLSCKIDAPAPTADAAWGIAIPAYKDGYNIWQKTTCLNHRGQILSTEIICISTLNYVASYWLRCSTRVHAGNQQKDTIEIVAMTKLGADVETEDTEVTLEYSWSNGATKIPEGGMGKYKLIFKYTEEAPFPNENLLITAKRNGVTYESETIVFSPLNTPTLVLSNDSDKLEYDSYGINKINVTDSVTSTAKLLLNNEEVSGVQYNWELSNCSNKSELPDNPNWNPIVEKTNSITIYHIADSADIATATCTATYTDNVGVEKALTKVFSITKSRQGKSLYKIDIENDFVTLPANEEGELPDSIKDDLVELTTHTVSCYFGDELVPITSYTTDTPNTQDTNFRLKYTAQNVALSPTTTIKPPNFAVASISEGILTGSVIYELYRGAIKVATAKFEVSKLVQGAQGAAATSYWVDYSARVHKGTNQQDPITATAWKQVGNSRAEWDDSKYIRYGWRKTDQEGNIFWDYMEGDPIGKQLTVDIAKFENADLIFELGSWDGTTKTFTKTDSEIITYSPIETPVLDLSNDSATLVYKPNGDKIGEAIVSSIATVFLNGEILTEGVEYIWTPISEDNIVNEVKDEKDKVIGSKISVSKLTSNTVEFTCTATITNAAIFKNPVTLTKVFTVSKQIQGENSISYWLKLSSGVHLGANQKTAITVTAMQKVGTSAIEDIDESAILFYKFNKEESWKKVPGRVVGEGENAKTYYDTFDSSAIKETIGETVEEFKFEDSDLLIKATHDKTLTEDTIYLEENKEKVFDEETITYSPLNTPTLDLDNDTATILYPAKPKDDSNGPLGTPVESTATLYLNGNELDATYTWNLEDCSASNTATITTVEDKTVTIATLSEPTARATCTAKVTAKGVFKDKTYTKVFTVSKTRKGDNAIVYSIVMDHSSIAADPNNSNNRNPATISGTFYIHNGESIQPFGKATYKYKIDESSLSNPQTANDDGTFIISNETSPISTDTIDTQIEIQLLVDDQIVDKEVIKVVKDGINAVSPYAIDIYNDTVTALSNTSILTDYDWTTNTKHSIRVLQGITPIEAVTITVKEADEYKQPAATDSLILTRELNNIAGITPGTDTEYEKIYSITGLTKEDLLKGEINYTLYNHGVVVATATFKFSTVLYGVDGRSIVAVKNYYCATPTEELPGSPDWELKISDADFNAINKYLWNYEEITYDKPDASGNIISKTDPEILSYWSQDAAPVYTIDIKNDFVTIPTNIINKQIYRSATNGKFNLLDSKYSILKEVSAARAISAGQLPGIRLQKLKTLAETPLSGLEDNEKQKVEAAKDLVENLETKPEITLPTSSESYTKDLSTHEITVYKGTEVQEITDDNFIIKLDREIIDLNTLPTDGFLLCEIGGYTSEGDLATDDFPGMNPTISDNVVTNYVTALGTNLTNVYINYTYYLNKQPIASAKFEIVRHTGPTTYYFDTNVSSIKVDNTGNTATTSISANAYSLTTSTGDKAAFNGHWKYGTNNSASTSTTGATLTITPLDTEVTNYVIELYEDSEYTKLWDRETISIIKDGKGVDEIVELYQVTDSSNPTPTKPEKAAKSDWEAKGWNTTAPVTDSSNPYLWNVEIIKYTNGDPAITDPVIIGTYGETFGVNIIPSVSSIVATETITENGSSWTYSPSTVTVKFTEVSGTTVIDCVNSQRDYRYKIYVDDTAVPQNPVKLTPSTPPATINLPSTSTKVQRCRIELELKLEDSTWINVDTENIPVVREGNNGADGADAVYYWIKGVEAVHTGANQTDTISVTAMKRVGNEPEQVDSGTNGAVIWYNNEGTWKSRLNGPNAANCHTLNFIAGEFKNDFDLKLILTHDKDWIPPSDVTATNAKVEGWEVITYSPLNSPILSLTNDSAALVYTTDNSKKTESDTVSSTAELYLNGSKITSDVSYEWRLVNCRTPDGLDTVYTDTVTIKYLSENSATATCIATYKSKPYTKVFAITKQLQGDKGDDGDAISIRVENAFYASDEYTVNTPDIPGTETQSSLTAGQWAILSNSPNKTELETSDHKLVFHSSRVIRYNETTQAVVETQAWSLPVLYWCKDENVYNILTTANGLFGYGQGVYYTYDPSELTETESSTPPESITINEKPYKKGEKIETSQVEIAKWIAKGNANTNDPLNSVENRKKVIKLYINAEYIQTGMLTVGKDTITQPTTGTNGNWWIGKVDTNIPVNGEGVTTPTIGENGNWLINNIDTGVKAEANGTLEDNEIFFQAGYEEKKDESGNLISLEPKVKIGGFDVTSSELATRSPSLGTPNLVLYNRGSTVSELVDFLSGEVTQLPATAESSEASSTEESSTVAANGESNEAPLFSCFSGDGATATTGAGNWENFHAIQFSKELLPNEEAVRPQVYWTWLQVNRSISDAFTIYLSHCGSEEENSSAPDYLMAFNPVYWDASTDPIGAVDELRELMEKSFLYTDEYDSIVGEFDQRNGALVKYTDDDNKPTTEPVPIKDKAYHLITTRDRTTAVNDGQYKDRCIKLTYAGLHKPDNYLMFIPFVFVVRNKKNQSSEVDSYNENLNVGDDGATNSIATIYIPTSGYDAAKAVEIGEKFKVSTTGQLVTTDPILGGVVSIPEKATIGAFEISDTLTNNALTLNHQGIRLMPEAKLRFMGADNVQSKLILESAQKETGVTATAINSLSSNYSPLAVGYNIDKADMNSSLAAITFDGHAGDGTIQMSANVTVSGEVASPTNRPITVEVTPNVLKDVGGQLKLHNKIPKSFIVSIIIHYSRKVINSNWATTVSAQTVSTQTDSGPTATIFPDGSGITIETGTKLCRITVPATTTPEETSWNETEQEWEDIKWPTIPTTVSLPGGYTFIGASTSISNNNAGKLDEDDSNIRIVTLANIAQTTYTDSSVGLITLTADTTVIGNITAATAKANDGTSATNKLTLGSTATNISGALDIYGTGDSTVFSVANDGTTTIAGDITAANRKVYADSFYASSDRRLKQNISALAEKQSQYNLLFDELNPVEFKFKADPEKRLHLGFIAQETDTAAKKIDTNLALVDTRNADRYSLNYLEIIALNTLQIKQLKAQVAELTKQLAEQTKIKS